MTPELDALLHRSGLVVDDVAELFRLARERTTAEVAIVQTEAAAGTAFPVVEFADVVAGQVAPSVVDAVRRRGCVVIHNTFEREQAEAWDAEVDEYLTRNAFTDRFAALYPDAAATTPQIWGVYWSSAQVDARQHPNMQTARRFLNSFWSHESLGQAWFDPNHDIGYPDRLRRRAPGAPAKGLPPHSDAVSSGGWRMSENELVFRRVFAGDLDGYDPWDAAHRTTPDPVSTAPSSVFRTFQGWTALSEMHPTDGVLHTIPIASAAAYMLIRGIADELGLVSGEPEPAPRRFRADEVLMPAMVPIPPVCPGDTVWWHGDVIHSVADATNETRWGNVMYIGAAPRCPRNDAYAASMLERFEAGLSPLDFPEEHFESEFVGRPTVADLTATGRAQFGLPATAG